MSLNEKKGDIAALRIEPPALTIEPPQPVRKPSRTQILSTIEDVDSIQDDTPNLTPSVTRHDNGHPFSPFYSHSKTRLSIEAEKSESKVNLSHVYESDPEACLMDSKNNILYSTRTNRSTNDCTVWPGQRALKQQRKALKRQHGCGPWRRLNKNTRVWLKVLIGLVIIGVAVAVGLGISKAVGGGVWKSSVNTNAPPV